jgi:uncharacterized SAM-binding protein YcdF (DUF218 family)
MKLRLGLSLGAIAGLLAWALVAGSWLVIAVPLDEPDAIVSLASHEWERLPEAAAASARYPRATVLLTRPDRVTKYNCHDCEHRVERLVRLGVPRERAEVLQLTAGGTWGEALAVRAAFQARGLHRLLVVTSPYHTRRALGIFRAVFDGGGMVVGIEPAVKHSPARPGSWWMAPYDRAYVAYEWAALVYYGVRHGVLPVMDPAGTRP